MANSLFIFLGNPTFPGTITVQGQGLFANGTTALPSIAFSTQPGLGFFKNATSDISITNGNPFFTFSTGSNIFRLRDTGIIGWNPTSDSSVNNADLVLARDAAGTLAQKNSTNAQVFRLYKTTTGPAYAFFDTTGILMGTSGYAFTNGAAAAAGTLGNAPVAGNPTKWIPINDNGTTRYIPAW